MNNSSINNTNLTGPNHLKIIPSSGVIYKNSKNSKTGNDIYKSKKGRMSYKEYVMLRKKYMEPNVNDTSKENTMYNVYPKKEENVKNNNINDINNKRSKSIKYKENNNTEISSKTMLYNTNKDENGKDVLNENLFKNRQMRKTFTGKFYQRKGSQYKEKKGEAIYNNNYYKFNTNIAYKSYYNGFMKNKK